MQTEFNFCERVENNFESNTILSNNKEHINNQCKRVLELLKSGERLTVYSALVHHGISSLPRRILDLKEKTGLNVKTEIINKRFKEYYL